MDAMQREAAAPPRRVAVVTNSTITRIRPDLLQKDQDGGWS